MRSARRRSVVGAASRGRRFGKPRLDHIADDGAVGGDKKRSVVVVVLPHIGQFVVGIRIRAGIDVRAVHDLAVRITIDVRRGGELGIASGRTAAGTGIDQVVFWRSVRHWSLLRMPVDDGGAAETPAPASVIACDVPDAISLLTRGGKG